MFFDWLEHKIGEFIAWAWDWIVVLSYWWITLTGILALMIFFATKEPKYRNYAVTGFIIYIFIMAADSL
jgi:hypothetical protein